MQVDSVSYILWGNKQKKRMVKKVDSPAHKSCSDVPRLASGFRAKVSLNLSTLNLTISSGVRTLPSDEEAKNWEMMVKFFTAGLPKNRSLRVSEASCSIFP